MLFTGANTRRVKMRNEKLITSLFRGVRER
jgi:hypothetical protein